MNDKISEILSKELNIKFKEKTFFRVDDVCNGTKQCAEIFLGKNDMNKAKAQVYFHYDSSANSINTSFIHVSSEFRNTSIGKNLIDIIEKVGKEINCDLSVAEHVLDGAVEFWKNNGYVRENKNYIKKLE